jgi:pimeloyl-ACP methyl ester carboxylesterase
MKAKRVLKSIGKWFLISLGGIVGLILIFLLLIRINSTGKEKPFLDEHGNVLANSIAVIEHPVINGVPQRLVIRGKDIRKPVLLRVHGGPGSTYLPPLFQLAGNDLEDLFVVCYWDQRGSGPAYTPDIPDSTLTLPQIVDDGLEVAEYLKNKFRKEKIYIEGASWGTTVSAYMVQKNPKIFHAYIGNGQMANQALSEQMSWDFVMEQAQKNNDSISIRQLLDIGRPPYPDKTNAEMAEACDIERLVVEKYVPFKPPVDNVMFRMIKTLLFYNGWSLKNKLNMIFNYDAMMIEPAYTTLWPTCFNINLIRDVPEWQIPEFIVQGENDHHTETSLAKEYFDSIQAPLKKWYLFEDAGHGANFEQPERYRSIIINDVLKEH